MLDMTVFMFDGTIKRAPCIVCRIIRDVLDLSNPNFGFSELSIFTKIVEQLRITFFHFKYYYR